MTFVDDVVGLRTVDLAQPLHQGIPTSPSHPGFKHSLLRRHGDSVRSDGTSGANDLLVLGTHTGTHIDALAHIADNGMLHGNVDAMRAQQGGRFHTHGVDQIPPRPLRGVLLDIPSIHGVARLPAGHPIEPDELAAAADSLPVPIRANDALLIRTGWAQLWDQGRDFLSHDDGVPGPSEAGAGWLAEREPAIVGSDTTAFEHIPAGLGHALLPAHRLLLVRNGIPIIEMLNLEELAAAPAGEFVFILSPLPLLGATGSPLRPLALVNS